MSDQQQRIKELTAQNLALEQRVSSLQATLDHIGAYVFMKDTNGCYTFVNSLVCELFNITPDDIIGKDDSSFFSLDESDDLRKNDLKVIKEGVTIECEERNVIASTGETRYYQTVKSPLKNRQGQVIGMLGVSTDVTPRKELEIELLKKQELLDVIMHNIDAYVYVKDRDYKFVYVNPRTAKLFGMELEEIVGRTSEEILPKKIADLFEKTDEQVFKTEQKHTGEECYPTKNGSYKYYWSIKVPLRDEFGKISRMIGFSTDITELSILKNKLEQQVALEIQRRTEQEQIAITDPLTGLYNRLKLDESLEKELDRAHRYDGNLGLILMDIDHFKQVNDNYGHQVGDKILIKIAEVLNNNIRKVDIVGRWGGEEFLIICPQTDEQGTFQLAENLRKAIVSCKFPEVGTKTASFGVTNYQNGDSPHQLLSRSDRALYKAKQNGRNKIETKD